MSKLTLEEFRKLPEDQKTERYKELSPHDMFLWRISDPGNPRVISRRALTKEQEEKEATERKVKIGTGDRSEKIRTYNYPQNRITDHRIGYTSMNLDRVMDGDMEDLIEALINEDQKKKLEGTI